jgi:hypothetical protein
MVGGGGDERRVGVLILLGELLGVFAGWGGSENSEISVFSSIRLFA